MQRAIVGFDQDEMGDWRAILACGHRQHVRHNPPLVDRAWVLTEEGRRRFLGVMLACKACDEGEPVGSDTPSTGALAAIYTQFRDGLWAYIRSRAGDEGTGEAIRRDVSDAIAAQLPTLGDERPLTQWLATIVDAAIGAPPDATAAAPLAEAVRGLVACLPGEVRQALILTDDHGLSPRQIGERLDIAPAAAASRVRRGRAMLAEALLDWCHWLAEA